MIPSLAAFPHRTVVIRTLDAGADKPLPFLPLGAEANPALGSLAARGAAAGPDRLPGSGSTGSTNRGVW